MRAREFVNESLGSSNMKRDHVTSIPNAHFFPDLDNSSGYKAYRFGLALAGIPHIKVEKEGPTGQKMVTVAYTPAENEMLDVAAGYFNTAKVELTPQGSTETDDVNKNSLLKPQGPISLKKK